MEVIVVEEERETGEGQAGVVIDGDVKGLGAGTGIAVGTVAGGADAWVVKAARLGRRVRNARRAVWTGRGPRGN